MQTRDYNIDLLKITACAAVVGLHTFQKDLSLLNSTLYYLCGFAIPIFFMCSGAFLLNKNEVPFKYSLRKICTVLRVVILWNILIVLARLLASALLGVEYSFTALTIPEEIMKSLVQKGMMWQFWYFGAMIILYLLLPFLHRLGAKRWIVMAIAGGGYCNLANLLYHCWHAASKNGYSVFQTMDMAFLLHWRRICV